MRFRVFCSSDLSFPQSGATLPAGVVSVRGAAYAGEADIVGVEISVDDGKSWQAAEFIGPHNPICLAPMGIPMAGARSWIIHDHGAGHGQQRPGSARDSPLERAWLWQQRHQRTRRCSYYSIGFGAFLDCGHAYGYDHERELFIQSSSLLADNTIYHLCPFLRFSRGACAGSCF